MCAFVVWFSPFLRFPTLFINEPDCPLHLPLLPAFDPKKKKKKRVPLSRCFQALETREQSNNLAELRAVIEAVEQTRGPLEINLIPSMS